MGIQERTIIGTMPAVQFCSCVISVHAYMNFLQHIIKWVLKHYLQKLSNITDTTMIHAQSNKS